ncbi:MAG: hypothetical protein ACW972_10720, partial [Promethearchaeota archaeon]
FVFNIKFFTIVRTSQNEQIQTNIITEKILANSYFNARLEFSKRYQENNNLLIRILSIEAEIIDITIH